MTRLVAVLVALIVLGGVAACSSGPAPLTDGEWAWCQDHWRDGLYASQSNDPQPSMWYFNHMGMRWELDTIRVCRASAKA